MENYIRYLVQDIRQAIGKTTRTTVSAEGDLMLPELEVNTSMSDYTGIDQNAFPPIELLSSGHLDMVLTNLKDLLASIQVELVLPKQLPEPSQYVLIVGHWSKPFILKLNEVQSLDFCSLDIKQCPYGDQFCYCKHFQTDWEDM